jgi:hypothetical protein
MSDTCTCFISAPCSYCESMVECSKCGKLYKDKYRKTEMCPECEEKFVIPLIPIPKDAECQEASIHSVTKYIACGKTAVTIIYNNDCRGYYMCLGCAAHNVSNRGGKVVTALDNLMMNHLREMER